MPRGRSLLRSISNSTRSRSRSRSIPSLPRTSTSASTPMSMESTSGKTSMKSPFTIAKGRKKTLKQKVKFIEKTLKYNEVKYIKGVITVATPLAISTTPVITPINFMSRSTTIQSRLADSVRALQFELSGVLTTNNTANVRIMIIADKNPLATAIKFSAVDPAIGYAFAGVASAAIQPYTMLNFNNTSIDEEFRIFFDKTYSLMTTNVYTEVISIKQKLDVECEYKGGNAGTVADLTKNALYLVVWGATSVGGAPAAGSQLTADWALYFQDN